MKNFIDIYGFSLLPVEMSNRLIAHGERIMLDIPLLDALRSKHSSNSIESISVALNTQNIVRGSDFAYMKDNEILEKTFVPSMLAYQIQSVASERIQFLKLKGFVYWCSKILVEHEGAISIVGEAAREVRLLASTTSRTKFWKHFYCEWLSLDELEKSLEVFSGSEFRGINEGKLLRLIKVVNLYLNPQPKSTRKANEKESVQKQIKIINLSCRYDDESYSTQQLVGLEGSREITGGEMGDDSKWLAVKNRTPSELDRDRTIKFLRGKEVANQLVMREVAPPARYSGLTADEIRRLVHVMIEGISNKDYSYVVIALMVIFGRSLRDAIDILKSDRYSKSSSVLRSRDSVCALKYTMELPYIRAASYKDLVLDSDDKNLFLPVPNVLNAVLSDKKLISNEIKKITVELVESKIQALNGGKNIRFTQTAISGVAYEIMRRRGFSESDILWVIGGTAKEFASLYYYTVKETTLRHVHYSYLNELSRISRINLLPVEIAETTITLGSRVFIQLERVKEIAASILYKKISLKNGSLDSISEFHNEFIFRSYFIFSLFAAHRDVRNPFQSICDFNPYNKTLWICDKNNRSSDSSRVIPLPDVVFEQLERLRGHYNRLALRLSLIDKILSKNIEKILDGENDQFLLSLLHSGKLKGVDARRIQENFSQHYSLPANWQRHFLRNYLADTGCSQDQINAFMGHANFGREAHGRWSAYGASESVKIRHSLNVLASELGVVALEGL